MISSLLTANGGPCKVHLLAYREGRYPSNCIEVLQTASRWAGGGDPVEFQVQAQRNGAWAEMDLRSIFSVWEGSVTDLLPFETPSSCGL